MVVNADTAGLSAARGEASAIRVSSRWPCRTTFAIGGRCEPSSQVVVGAALRCWRRRRPTAAVGGVAEAPLQTLARIVAGEDDPVDRRLQERRTQTRLTVTPGEGGTQKRRPGSRLALVFDSRSRGIWVRRGNRGSGAGEGSNRRAARGRRPSTVGDRAGSQIRGASSAAVKRLP
jgi:hypothetical protein